jgi:hypothetical protein
MTGEHHQRVVESIPRRLVFRIPAISQVGVFFAFLSGSVVALAGPKLLLLLYLIPIGLSVWLWRVRTIVDPERIVVRRMLHTKVIGWSQLAGLRVREHKWVRAVLTDGGEIALPSVRPRHLPALALVSGGRLADPTEPAAQRDEGAADESPQAEAREDTVTGGEAAASPVEVADETGANV